MQQHRRIVTAFIVLLAWSASVSCGNGSLASPPVSSADGVKVSASASGDRTGPVPLPLMSHVERCGYLTDADWPFPAGSYAEYSYDASELSGVWCDDEDKTYSAEEFEAIPNKTLKCTDVIYTGNWPTNMNFYVSPSVSETDAQYICQYYRAFRTPAPPVP